MSLVPKSIVKVPNKQKLNPPVNCRQRLVADATRLREHFHYNHSLTPSGSPPLDAMTKHETKRFSSREVEVTSGVSKWKNLCRSVIIVGGNYLASVYTLGWDLGDLPHHESPSVGLSIGLAMLVCLLTLTHGFLVGSFGILIFRSIFRGTTNYFQFVVENTHSFSERVSGFLIYGFLVLWFGIWFSVPMLILSGMTGRLTIAWALFHLAMTRPGHRMIAFIENGSTSLALLLCSIVILTNSWWAITCVLVFQIFLLTAVEQISELVERRANAKNSEEEPETKQKPATGDYVIRAALLIGFVLVFFVSRDLQQKQRVSRETYRAVRAHFESLGGTLDLGGADIDDRIDLANTSTRDQDLAKIHVFAGGVDQLDLGGTQITDASLQHVVGLKHLSFLNLSNTKISDDGLKALRFHDKGYELHLYEIDLSDTQITDAGLAYLQDFSYLRKLNLSGTAITGSGLHHLNETALRKIDLSRTQVDDQGLEFIADYVRLVKNRRIDFVLEETKVSRQGLDQFRKEFPGVAVGSLAWLSRPPARSTAMIDRFRALLNNGTPEEVRRFMEQSDDERLTAIVVSGDGSALHHVTVRARDRVAAVLLDLGADPNVRGANQQTPLHVACRLNRPNVVRLLLRHGADVTLLDSEGATPRQHASQAGRSNILQILDQFDAP